MYLVETFKDKDKKKDKDTLSEIACHVLERNNIKLFLK